MMSLVHFFSRLYRCLIITSFKLNRVVFCNYIYLCILPNPALVLSGVLPHPPIDQVRGKETGKKDMQCPLSIFYNSPISCSQFGEMLYFHNKVSARLGNSTVLF